jgi:hypothetical protein
VYVSKYKHCANGVFTLSLPKVLLNLPANILRVSKDNSENTSWKNSNVSFLTCSCTSYISRVFSYCLCLAAWKAVGPLNYTLISLQVSLVHACGSYLSPGLAAAAGVLVVAAAVAVADAAAAVLRAVAAGVEDLGTPCCVLLVVVVVVGVVLLVPDGEHCSRWE